MGASTATAPCGARSTRLGRAAGGADGSGGGGPAGVNRSAALGPDHTRNYERLDINPKLAAVLATGCSVLITSDHEISRVVSRVFERQPEPPVDTSERTCPSTMRERSKPKPRCTQRIVSSSAPPETATSGGNAWASSLAICRPVRHPPNCSPRVTSQPV